MFERYVRKNVYCCVMQYLYQYIPMVKHVFVTLPVWIIMYVYTGNILTNVKLIIKNHEIRQ